MFDFRFRSQLGADVAPDSIQGIRQTWFFMLEPPWHHSGPAHDQFAHGFIWSIGWAWAVAGVVLGALVAPSLVQFAGLAGSPYQDALVIGVAVLAGLLVQVLGWCLFAGVIGIENVIWLPTRIRVPINVVVILSPLVGVSYSLYRYFTWVGPGQRSVTVGFIGALLVKTFLIPFIKGLVTGALFKWFMGWLRGDRVKVKGA